MWKNKNKRYIGHIAHLAIDKIEKNVPALPMLWAIAVKRTNLTLESIGLSFGRNCISGSGEDSKLPVIISLRRVALLNALCQVWLKSGQFRKFSYLLLSLLWDGVALFLSFILVIMLVGPVVLEKKIIKQQTRQCTTDCPIFQVRKAKIYFICAYSNKERICTNSCQCPCGHIEWP